MLARPAARRSAARRPSSSSRCRSACSWTRSTATSPRSTRAPSSGSPPTSSPIWPWLLKPLLSGVARKTRKDPDAAARKYAQDLPDADRAVLDDPAMWAIHSTTSAEAVSSPAAFAREARLLAKPWGVEYDAVTAPVALWVGELDPVHPPVMARRLAQRFGGAPVTVVPGAATFAMVPVIPDALRHAAALA